MTISKQETDTGISLKEADKIENAVTEIMGNMKQGMNPQEATGLDPQFVESLYAQAYHLYNTGKYTDAAHVFRTLILMNAMEFKYVLGLAACHHLLKEYESAIKVYTVCSVLDPNDPLPYYHSSDCYIQLQDYLSAYVALKMTLKAAGEKVEFATIKERALLSLEGVQEDLKKTGGVVPETSPLYQSASKGSQKNNFPT